MLSSARCKSCSACRLIYALAWVLWHAVRVKTNFKGDKYIRADGRLDDEERVALSLGELYQQLYHRAARVWPLPQHCRGSLTSKNLTRQWTLEEGKPFYCGLSAQPLQEKDLRKMLERWRPHCRYGDNYSAHIVDFMRHYFSDGSSVGFSHGLLTDVPGSLLRHAVLKIASRSIGFARTETLLGRPFKASRIPVSMVQQLIGEHLAI